MTIVNNDLVFLNNVYNTCKANKLIREDGNPFTIFDRLKEVLWRIFSFYIPRDQQLLGACRRFSVINLTYISDTNVLVKSIDVYDSLSSVVGKLRYSRINRHEGFRLLDLFKNKIKSKQSLLQTSTNSRDRQLFDTLINRSISNLLQKNTLTNEEIAEINQNLSLLGGATAASSTFVDKSLFIDRFFECVIKLGTKGAFDRVTHVRALESILRYKNTNNNTVVKVLHQIQNCLGKNQITNLPQDLRKNLLDIASKYIWKMDLKDQEAFRTQLFEDGLDVDSYDSLHISFDSKFEEIDKLLETYIVDTNTVESLLQKLEYFKKCSGTIYWPIVRWPMCIYLQECCKWLNFLSTIAWNDSGRRNWLENKYPIVEAFFGLFKGIKLDEKEKVILKLALSNLPPHIRNRIRHQTMNPAFAEESNAKEQVQLILESLEQQETNLVKSIVDAKPLEQLQKNDFSAIPRFAKLIASNDALASHNLLQLRNSIYGKTLIKSLTVDNAKHYISSRCTGNYSSGNLALLIERLKRTVKAKKYFQLQSTKKYPAIPRHYHATPAKNVNSIAEAQKIEVRHEKAYKGFWTSRRREPGYGEFVLGFTNKLIEVDPTPQHNYDPSGLHKWRGAQNSLEIPNLDEGFLSKIDIFKLFTPIKEEKESLLCLIGVQNESSKVEQKKKKREIRTKLGKDIAALSFEQVDFMQRFILNTIGEPNLSQGWYFEDPSWKTRLNRR